jgi:3-dehydroquinate dehydratase
MREMMLSSSTRSVVDIEAVDATVPARGETIVSDGGSFARTPVALQDALAEPSVARSL